MTFETLLLYPQVQAVGWALLHFLWQGTLLAALLMVANVVTRRSQARLRYAIGCAVMLLMPVTFVATAVRNDLSPARFWQAPPRTISDLDAPPASQGRVSNAGLPGRVRLRTVPASTRPAAHSPLALGPAASGVPAGDRTWRKTDALPGWAVCLWLVGVMVLSLYTASGWLRAQRLRRRGIEEPPDPAWIAALEQLMRQLGISRPVRLYASALAEVPTMIGWLRPYILLPVSALTGLSEAQLRAVLAHELAHIRRHDYLVNLLQSVVETLLFYHPAVWWVSRRIREERENCCDDLAVALCGDVVVYAGALAQLEELRGTVAEPAMAATRGNLLARIHRLMGTGQTGDRIPRSVGAALAAALVIGAVIGAGNAPAIHAQAPARPIADGPSSTRMAVNPAGAPIEMAQPQTPVVIRTSPATAAAPQSTPAAARVSFTRSLYPVLEKAGCRACHNPDGVASATRLHFPEADATPDRIEAFGKSLVMLVDRENPEESLLFQKPTARIPHTGGQRIKPGSPEEAALKTWVETLAHFSASEVSGSLKLPPQSSPARIPGAVLRRLTNSQYNNTVRDLLGDQSAPASQFPQEDFVDGFKNQYEAQNLSPLLYESYSATAEKLARNAFRGGDTHGLIPCRPSADCRGKFVRSFGLKAFRRPLDPEEERRYALLMRSEPDFLKAAQLVVEAMLQSPNFLFWIDETANSRWQPYAAATRLSYTLWDTMPDAVLFEAAERGELSTLEGVNQACRRMLDHPHAHEALDEFVSQWLRFDRVLTTTKDKRRYPQFSRETAVAMTEEALHFVGDLVWNDRNFMNAFTANYGFPNADLASIYGVAVNKDFERVEFPAAAERGGLLGQALFLTLTSKPEDSSLTARGLFVREQFLCQKVPPAPAFVNTNLPPISEARPQTNRDRMSEHVASEFCANCHNLMDPIGFGLEKFDAIGARREKFQLAPAGDRRTRAAGKTLELPLNTHGRVAGIAGSDFSSPRELGVVLARTPQCQECMVKQYFRYIAGRPETPADDPAIHRALDDFRNSGFRYKELMLSLVRSREFTSVDKTVHVAHNRERAGRGRVLGGE